MTSNSRTGARGTRPRWVRSYLICILPLILPCGSRDEASHQLVKVNINIVICFVSVGVVGAAGGSILGSVILLLSMIEVIQLGIYSPLLGLSIFQPITTFDLEALRFYMILMAFYVVLFIICFFFWFQQLLF